MKFWPLIKLLPKKTNLQFVRLAPIFGAISALACVVSLVMALTPFQPPCGGLSCGVDFRGGTVLELSTAPRPADLGEVRATMQSLNFGDVQVQGFDAPENARIRFETPDGLAPAVAVEQAKAALRQSLGEVNFTRQDVVGASVSGELLFKGVLALVLATVMVLLYIWFRFGLTFGVGAIVALLQDVILTFGFFVLFDLEFTLTAVAAILTIIGYSINDKVVVLDRVRENLRKYKKMPLGDLIDLSVNETVSRTIITGLTGIMALSALAVFGGEALFAFSVSMIFGIVVGTYSSVYIAAPLLLLLGVRRGDEDAVMVGPAAEGRPVPRP
jgi:preprotein translocase SecF subunit